jgi:hypothetical protein
MMERTTGICIVISLFVLFSQPVFAEEKKAENVPWEKFSLHLGVFISEISSDLRFGSGIGVDVSVEDLLDMDSSTALFRVDGLWRFTQNRRHRLDFSWYVFRRDGSSQIAQDFPIKDEDDNEVIIPAGTQVESYFDIDIYKLAYSYSFFQDDRFDLALSFGLFIMPTEFGFNASGLVVVGFRGDFALTPKWFLRMGTEIFYLEYEQFKGSLYNGKAAVEYKPWKHVGIGLGVDAFRLDIEAEGEDFPGIDFKGNIEFNYFGLQLYTKIFF